MRQNVTTNKHFDQPLYWKALSTLHNESCDQNVKSVVLRLGGFHMKMSFLGSMGHLISSSGLQDVIETIYAPNAVGHMLSGKAVSRAVRAHLLVSDALNAIMVSKTFGIELTNDKDTEHERGQPIANELENSVSDSDLLDVLQLYDTVMDTGSTVKVQTSEPLGRLMEQIKVHVASYYTTNRTEKIWLQYLEMVSLLKTFLAAERTGNWKLHLETVKNMLPYFAASGHNLYLKSSYVYHQLMHDLENTHPDVYDCFMEGNHVIRRSDRFWAALSSDLVIEQVLMRSMKTNGGMTRGRGMTETQRAIWLLYMPLCTDTNADMQDLTNTHYYTSGQHKENTNYRIQRDTKDTNTLVNYFQQRCPFDEDNTSLRCIHTGVIADTNVNIDDGQEVVKNLPNNDAFSYSFKRSNQVITMQSKTSVKIGNETIVVDPQLLFQRLTTVATRMDEDISTMFEYELCTFPAAIFDNNGLPREALKPPLADAIWRLGNCAYQESSMPSSVKYVLDGGSLLHRIL